MIKVVLTFESWKPGEFLLLKRVDIPQISITENNKERIIKALETLIVEEEIYP